MPISYETAAPIAMLGDIAARGAADRRVAAAASAGGRGFGQDPRAFIPYDTGIQDAVEKQDRMRLAQEEMTGRNTIVPAEAIFRHNSMMASQQQSAALDAELSQVKLSQQENMRLQRMKNAMGAIAADPTWSDAEKRDIIAKLQTGISPLEERANREQQAARSKMMQSHAELYQLQAGLAKQQADAEAAGFEKREHFAADPQALAEISQDIRDSFPLGTVVPEGLVAKMAKQEAIRQGLGTHGFIDKKGTFSPYDKATGGGRSAAAAKQTGPALPNGMDANDYLKAVKEATAVIERRAKESTKDGMGKVTFTNPELQSADERQRAVEKMLFDQGLPAKWSEFTAQASAPTQPQGGPRKYDAKAAPWRKKEQEQMGPQQPQGPEAPTEAYRNAVSMADEQLKQIQSAGISNADKNYLSNIVQAGKRIMLKYPDLSKMTDEDVAALARLNQKLEEATRTTFAGPPEGAKKPASSGEQPSFIRSTRQ